MARFRLDDGMGRTWTHAWIAVHYGICAQAGLTFVDAGDEHASPLLLVANIPGQLERLLGIVLEKCNGELPFWMAPTQILVIPITRKETDAALDLARALGESGWRSDVDLRQESMGAKIRRAELNKVPMMVILGKREVSSGTASLRTRDKGVIGEVDRERLLTLANEELKKSLVSGLGIKLVDDEIE
jgi:threonyl-tRNA synthetase